MADVLTLLDQIEDHLDRERSGLLRGDLDGIARLGEQKALLVRQLAKEGLAADPGRLDALRRKSERNADLIEAARDGAAAAAARIAALRDGPAVLDGYDASGQRIRMSATGGRSLARRA